MKKKSCPFADFFKCTQCVSDEELAKLLAEVNAEECHVREALANPLRQYGEEDEPAIFGRFVHSLLFQAYYCCDLLKQLFEEPKRRTDKYNGVMSAAHSVLELRKSREKGEVDELNLKNLDRLDECVELFTQLSGTHTTNTALLRAIVNYDMYSYRAFFSSANAFLAWFGYVSRCDFVKSPSNWSLSQLGSEGKKKSDDAYNNSKICKLFKGKKR